MKSLAHEAMMFAREKHQGQVRKYTGEPYFNHLAEVVAISMSVVWQASMVHHDKLMAIAWLHDVVEDTDVRKNPFILDVKFGHDVAHGIWFLTDLEPGNRKQKKEVSRGKLSYAPGWVQTIKCADLISNATSIIKHDQEFAKVFCAEALALLDVMDNADSRLRDMAYGICKNENREMSKMLEE